MDYMKHYKNLIRNARYRQAKSGYMEKHHIIPKCLISHKSSIIKNGRWNLVELTSREHFIAHKLLWRHYNKLFGKGDKRTKKLMYAWAMFFKGRKDKLTSRQFENLRCCYSKSISGENNPMFGKQGPNKGKLGKDHPMFGRKRPEHSVRMSGENHPLYGKEGFWSGHVGPNKGKTHTEETKKKMRAAWEKRKSSNNAY
jgi:hypothetical protein